MRVIGIGMDAAGRGLIGIDRYRLEISKEGFAFKGMTVGNQGQWDNYLFGTTEAGQYMVHTW